MLLVDHASNP